MFLMLRLLPLLAMEMTNPENEPDDDPFLKILESINSNLAKITDHLPSKEVENGEEDPDSHATSSETSSETETPLETPASQTAEPEKVETESPPPKPKKRAPWDRRK